MERYENLGMVGEGSYGMVLKCKHKESNQIVAIKKFIESEDDKMVKKIAMREIRMLKQLRHENLVNLLEVFRRKKRLYLVFEFVDRTVLDDLERKPDGLDDINVKKISFQVLRGLEFCHSHNIIHRDVKPENILISKSGIVKLCDFGFARTLAIGPGEVFTDYVATRWYRAPELLVGDINYGKAVDVWAVGCLLFEMITGDPLFPGDSDIDQLFHITKHLGNLSQRHLEIFHRNPLFTGMRLPNVRNAEYLKKYKKLSTVSHDLIIKSLALEAADRPSCLEMIKHCYFDEGNFSSKFLETLKEQIEKETVLNPLLKSIAAHKSDNSSKENKKERRQKERQEAKSQQEPKKKKETKSKEISKESSVHSLPHYPSVSSSIDTDKRTTKASDKKHNSSVEDTEVVQQSSEPNQQHNKKKLDQETYSDRINAQVSISQAPTEGRGGKQVDFDHSETKLSLRLPLDVSVNTLGKNLPDISHATNANRAHGHDVIKQTKTYKKKPHNKHSEGGTLCPMSEKSPTYLEHSHRSFEELNEKLRKESRRELSDIDISKKSGLHLPSVTAKSMKTGQSRGGMRKHTTIPHIQNIDPFASTGNQRESPPSNIRSHHRDGNLPAV